MSIPRLTREFSICLIPTEDTIKNVESLRSQLPESPYRDDIPHITLLRGIKSTNETTDQELSDEVNELLNLSGSLPFKATVTKIANKSNQFYSSSGLLLLRSSKELLAYRASIAATLTENDFVIESQELDEFMPHVTIRLGVPLKGSIFEQAENLFENKIINFSSWILFRLVLSDGKRTMHEVRPNSA